MLHLSTEEVCVMSILLEEENNFNTIPRQGGNSQDAAFRVREQFARFLNSPEGRMG
jgi:hypothetical protein